MYSNDNLAKLNEIFKNRVLVYDGDDELISNANDEYNFTEDEVIRTDGSVNFAVMMVNGENHSQYVTYRVMVRGATYIIAADKSNGSWDFTLYVNAPAIDTKISEIEAQYNKMVEEMGSVEYYINDWRVRDSIVKDGMSIEEINCL